MEMSVIAAEDSLRTDSTPVSTSSPSLIKINSISIDLLNANDEGCDTQKCEHFSIRGYVSQIRKKNKKTCWPFPIVENDNKSDSATCLLPPLDVHKFRWWRCKNCLQDIVDGCARKDNEIVPSSCRCGFKSNATCSHVPSLDDVALPPNSQQPPKPFLIEGRKFDANSFTSKATSEDLPLSHSKERKYEVEHNTLIGHGLTDMNQKNARTTCIAAKVNPCTQKIRTNDGPVTPKSKCNGFAGVLEVATAGGEELTNASSGSDEIKSHGAPRRKFRKVRLLAELLEENRVAKTDCTRTSGSCSNAVSDVSSRQGTFSILQGPVAVQGGNVKWGFLGEKRKRKLPRDEEWRPPMSSLNNADMTDMASEDAETESDEDAVVRANPQMDLNCSFAKHKVQNDTAFARKKKTQVIDLNKSHCEMGDISETDGTADVFLSAVPDTFTDKGTDPFPSHDQRMKRKSNLYESEIKISQVDDRMASVVPLHDATLVAVPTAGNDMEVTQTEILTGPIQSSQQAFTRKRLDYPFNSYLTTPRYDKIYSPQGGGELPSSLPWHGGTTRGMSKSKETNFTEDSRTLLKSALNGVYGNGVNVEPSRKGIIYKMPFLNDKHKHSSHVEDGVGTLMHHQMPFSNPNSNGKTIGDQEHLAVTKKHTSRRADKVSELGTSDDIPMEIVELMAKNQYERCLHDAEREKQHPETMNNRSTQILDFTAGYVNKEFISLRDEIARKQKTQAKSGRDGIRVAGGYMGNTKQKFREDTNSEAQLHAPSSSGYGSPQNCLWIGDQARPRSLIACNTCQTQPQMSKEAASKSLWPSTIPNHTPFGFNISHKCEAQSANEEMRSQRPNSMHKRNISGDPAMKFKTANVANHGQHQKNNLGSDPDYRFGCKHRTVPPKKTTGSLDLYSNETIPAMHLLSLMDAGVRSGASSCVEETQKLLKKPLFPQEHHPREFPAQLEYFPGIQIGGASTSSFQQNRNFQRMTSFTGQVSPKCPQKVKNKAREISSHNVLCQQPPTFSLLSGGRNHAVVSHLSSEQMFRGDLHPPPSPFQSHLIGDPTGKQKLDGNVSTRNMNLETEICSVNRNPADFSIPGVRNGYMIRGEDLKLRKRYHASAGSAHNKQQKNVKLAAAKERVRQRNM